MELFIGFSKPKNHPCPVYSYAIRAFENTPYSHVYIRWYSKYANTWVCFEASVDVELVKADLACKLTMRFKSVIGYGKAYFVDDTDLKAAALDIITRHYWGKPGLDYNESILDKTVVIKIEIDGMTGKKSQP